MTIKKPTSFDIAERAGVSQPTVSRALSNSSLVSKKTRDRIHAIAKELGYQSESRKSPSKTTKTIALVFGDNILPYGLSPFTLSLVDKIIVEAASRGLNTLIAAQYFEKHGNTHDVHQCEAALFIGQNDFRGFNKKVDTLNQGNIPFVGFGPILPNQPGVFVGFDDTGGAHSSTQHLIEKAHTAIAFFGHFDSTTPHISARYSGYSKALLEAGLMVDPNLQFNVSLDGSNCAAAVQTLVERYPHVTAITCASDEMALKVIRHLKDLDKTVPDDIAIVGYEDIPGASVSIPSLTTVHQDNQTLAITLLNKLTNLLDDKVTHSLQLPVELIVRESSEIAKHTAKGCQ